MALLIGWLFRGTGRSGSAPVAPVTSDVVSRGPSIAILPFTNAGGQAGDDYFSDGLTQDLIAELSRVPELGVIALSSTAVYRESTLPPQQIGAELNARFVLQGSVRRAGDRIRISAQLLDADDGRSLWADNFESDLTVTELFELQDDLTQQLVNALAGTYGALTRINLERSRRKPPASLDSYDCVLRVYEYLTVHIDQNHLAARDCLEVVVSSDPEYAEAQAWLGYIYSEEYHHRRNERTGRVRRARSRGGALPRGALRLDPGSHVAYGALSLTLFFRGDYERARVAGLRTIELSPNNALWLSLIGTYLVQQEDLETGLPMVERSIELQPIPPPWIELGLLSRPLPRGGLRGGAPVGARGSTWARTTVCRRSWRRPTGSSAALRTPAPISRSWSASGRDRSARCAPT